ncbi:hypothetical protein [Erythrobacter litoralis]|uniref:Uncharacterized protein n=1 Tax=Erythrobacter litoralis (strain HTCC2594) TaxID=314225 RepID=Q2NC25_ERYLH|nr:hypothetical protein [Erythrobacter litoralis]ABC62766.1 hypothetical protein ELI_03370 [Erythrobacter litoralis HTCC2594]
MDWGGPTFVVLLVAISTAGWLINNWIRARHGYSLENEWGGMTDPTDSGETKRLKAENAELKSQIDSMQDRMVNLERIVTDKGYRLSDEIEALRDRPARNTASHTGTDSGVPLDLNKKEQA